MTKNQDNPADLLVDAMLARVAESGWRGVTLAEIVERAGLSPSEGYAICPARAVLLNLYARRVDLAAVAGLDVVPDDPEAQYDQLLDIMMQRFEAIEPDRLAVMAIVEDVMREPDTLLCLLPQSQRSFSYLATAAGFPDRGPAGCLFAKALSGVWLVTQRVWMRDESADLAETMAALDKNLRRAVETFGSLPGRPLGERPVPDEA